MSDSRPIIGFNGARGKRYEWEEFDSIMRGAIVTFTRREVAKNGLHERIISIGSTADGRHFRSREFYAI
jgi:hypothetical protein